MAPTDTVSFVVLTAVFTVISSGSIEKRQVSQEEFNCPKSFGAFPDGYACNTYWLCQFDQSTSKVCPHGLNYNPHVGSCDWPGNSPCVERNGVAFRQAVEPAEKQSEVSITENDNSSALYEFDMPEITTQKTRKILRRRKTTTPTSTTQKTSNYDADFDSVGITSNEIKTASGRASIPEEPNNNETISTTAMSPHQYTIIRMSAKPGIFRRRNRTGPLMFRPSTQPITTSLPITTTQSQFNNYDNGGLPDSNLAYNELDYDTDIPETTRPTPKPSPTTTTRQIITRMTTRRTTTTTRPRTIKTIRTTTTKPTINEKGLLQGRKLGKMNQPNTNTPSDTSTASHTNSPSDYEYEDEINNEYTSQAKATSVTKFPTPIPLSEAKECNKANCQLPNCRCGGTDIPGGLKVNDIPQIILITFDDAVNDINYKLYEELFKDSRTNPNGCPILGTFYIWHEWTSYALIQTLYSRGHEIASHTIRHQNMKDFTKDQWADEMVGERDILIKFANVKSEDVKGIRSPFLQIGGDEMFQMMQENGFLYDSSITVSENNPPYFPYTLDYHLSHQCMMPPCPTKSYPGLWEVPAVNFQGITDGKCSMVDACVYTDSVKDINQTFYKNFERHYTSNRAPLPLYFHSVWFDNSKHREGFIKFIETVNALPDVYIITTSQMLEWMMKPTPLSEIKDFEPWKCDKKDLPEACTAPNMCEIKHEGQNRYMGTCNTCPSIYPWIQNVNGDNV